MNSLSLTEILALMANPVSSRLFEEWVDLDSKNSEKVVKAVMSVEPWLSWLQRNLHMVQWLFPDALRK